MTTEKKNTLLSSFLCIISVLLLTLVYKMTQATSLMLIGISQILSSGIPPDVFSKYTAGLLAGGTIEIIPNWILLVIGMVAVFFGYLATYIFINRETDSPLKKMLKLSYWKSFQQSFIYKEPVFVKKKAIRIQKKKSS